MIRSFSTPDLLAAATSLALAAACAQILLSEGCPEPRRDTAQFYVASRVADHCAVVVVDAAGSHVEGRLSCVVPVWPTQEVLP